MNPDKRLEAKLHSSPISNTLEKEVVDKLEWYRMTLYNTAKELNNLKNRVWTESPYKEINYVNVLPRQMDSTKSNPS
jgi:hypothetical protein